MFVDAARRDLSVELFGMRLPSPLLMAPIGVIGLCVQDGHGDLAAADAAARTGVPTIASTLSADPLEDVAARFGGTPGFFQLYTPTNRDLAASLVSRAELIHKTGVTKAAAVFYTAWARRAAEHPQVFAALAAGELSESVARTICTWTDKLPEDCREAADTILISAALAGMDQRDLAGLAAEIYERSRPDLPDEDPAGAFEDRGVRLETTFQGAGVLAGDLTPECAAVVTAVLDALSAPAGAEDTRTHAQRYHDALHEAMTSTKDCVLLCPFHHQVIIHRWGWTLVLNSDGTTTAWNKDKTKVLHSHSPPAWAG